MRIKSYFAKSVDEAIAQAREQLGAEAMLLDTRRRAPKPGQTGSYEVVFGLDDAPPEPAVPLTSAPPISTAKPEHLGNELARLNAQMDEIRSLIVRSSKSQMTIGRSVPELADAHLRLLAAEVEPVLAKDIVDRLEAAMATDAFFDRIAPASEKTANRWKALRVNPDRLQAFVKAEMERRVRVEPRLGTVVVLVGPTGAGKTTTVVKLAANSAKAGRPVRMFTVDTARPSGYLQLQSLATSLGLPFSTVQSLQQLPALVADASRKELVLIDTPGYAGDDRKGVETTAEVLSKCPGVDMHLVVPGYMRASDIRRCIARYEIFGPTKLLVTKLDETEVLGPIFSESARAGLSLSYLTNGPVIPDDIRAASLEDFVALVLDRGKPAEQWVA